MKTFYLIISLLLTIDASAHIESTALEAIEVIDHNEKQSLVDFIPSVTTVRGKELQKRRQTNLGDTLQNEAGVNSTSFGPNAGRPVIRGLEGDRIRILQNGLGTLDASTQSADHALPVDVLTIDQIEVVRGPMGLLYGSSAVGGVVNVVTNRIHSVYDEGFFSQILVQGETASKGVSSGLQLNYGARNWMFHVDGSTRNLADQKLPEHVKGGPDDTKGKLPNSANKQDNVAVGASHIFGRGYFGFSYNHFATNYGTVADEDVSIEMKQDRFELHGEWQPDGGFIRKWKLRSAQSDYKHEEFHHGHAEASFLNKGNETRVEAINKKGDLEGVIGVQTQVFKFTTEGEEAFLPKTDNLRAALFTYQELKLSDFHSISAGLRGEHFEVQKKAGELGPSDERNFFGMSASLGHQYRFNKNSSLSSSYSYTERAPNFQELYADGDREHVANGISEQGDSSLSKEKAHAFEINYKVRFKKTQFVLGAYTQVFKDYISLNPLGTQSSGGFDEYRYEQVDALFYGADLEGRQELGEWRRGVLSAFSTADIVRAKNTDSGKNLPRISPGRVSFGLEYARDAWHTDIEIQYAAHQTKTAPNEPRTDDYLLTHLGGAYRWVGSDWGVSLFGRIRNVFDVEARNHVSTLKEIAPMPGRNFILGVQAQL